jgi:hypothetical protein
MKKRLASAGPHLLVAFSLALCILPQAASAVPQQGEDPARKIWVDLQKRRPASPERAPLHGGEAEQKGGDQAATARPRYQRMTRPLPPLKVARPARGRRPRAGRHDSATPTRDRSLGITIWRLRPSTPADAGRDFIHDSSEDWVPVRVSMGTPLAEGDRVRVSIESPEPGYLYVINREEYANGSRGEPALIFPTTRIRDGDNHVKSGRLVELPSQQDDVPYFTVRPSRRRPDQVGELLTIIVTAQPLALDIGPERLRLPEGQVLEWEQRWVGPWELIEQVGGEGTPWTHAEREAGLGASRELVQDDPLPQSIYRVRTKADATLLVSVSLPFKRAAGK